MKVKVGFLFNFLDYVKSHLSVMIRMFKGMFLEGEVIDETLKRIESFARGKGDADMTAKVTEA